MSYNLYVNTHEHENERAHVHIGRGGRKSENDPKIWIDRAGVEFAITKKGLARFKTLRQSEVTEVLEFVERNRDLCLRQWEKLHGKPTKRVAKKKK